MLICLKRYNNWIIPQKPIYGSDGFWITFWNLNQLWTLVTPDIASSWTHSMLEIYDKGGWLARGPTGIEYSAIMVASHHNLIYR